jgi:virginiamycin A acetyltransferase
VKNPRIIIGEYTYYDDVDGADQFEKHVTHFYDFIGDKLIIGKFCRRAFGKSPNDFRKQMKTDVFFR